MEEINNEHEDEGWGRGALGSMTGREWDLETGFGEDSWTGRAGRLRSLLLGLGTLCVLCLSANSNVKVHVSWRESAS